MPIVYGSQQGQPFNNLGSAAARAQAEMDIQQAQFNTRAHQASLQDFSHRISQFADTYGQRREHKQERAEDRGYRLADLESERQYKTAADERNFEQQKEVTAQQGYLNYQNSVQKRHGDLLQEFDYDEKDKPRVDAANERIRERSLDTTIRPAQSLALNYKDMREIETLAPRNRRVKDPDLLANAAPAPPGMVNIVDQDSQGRRFVKATNGMAKSLEDTERKTVLDHNKTYMANFVGPTASHRLTDTGLVKVQEALANGTAIALDPTNDFVERPDAKAASTQQANDFKQQLADQKNEVAKDIAKSNKIIDLSSKVDKNGNRIHTDQEVERIIARGFGGEVAKDPEPARPDPAALLAAQREMEKITTIEKAPASLGGYGWKPELSTLQKAKRAGYEKTLDEQKVWDDWNARQQRQASSASESSPQIAPEVGNAPSGQQFEPQQLAPDGAMSQGPMGTQQPPPPSVRQQAQETAQAIAPFMALDPKVTSRSPDETRQMTQWFANGMKGPLKVSGVNEDDLRFKAEALKGGATPDKINPEHRRVYNQFRNDSRTLMGSPEVTQAMKYYPVETTSIVADMMKLSQQIQSELAAFGQNQDMRAKAQFKALAATLIKLANPTPPIGSPAFGVSPHTGRAR